MSVIEGPVPFIQHVDGKFKIAEEGVEALSSVTTPVCVIAVAGLYRTGKSFFLNNLAGTVGKKTAQFKVGSTSESCTRGINLWVTSDELTTACGAKLLLLDTEGMASMDQDEAYDAQVFALGLLLSSYFVLNSMGVIDEAAVDRLFLVSELSKHISVQMQKKGDADGDDDWGDIDNDDDDKTLAEKREQEKALGEVFPPFMWLLRDFVVDLEHQGKPITPDQYLEQALSNRPGASRRAGERNEIRGSLRNLFSRRKCCTLVRPALDEEQVRHAADLAPEQLRPEFREQLGTIREGLLTAVKPKTMFGQSVNGRTLLRLAQRYVGTLNEGGVVPTIKGAWEYVVEDTCKMAVESALECYNKRMKAAVAGEGQRILLPSAAQFVGAHHAHLKEACRQYEEEAIGSSDRGSAQQRGRERLVGEARKAREG
jgi:hypothetical protein